MAPLAAGRRSGLGRDMCTPQLGEEEEDPEAPAGTPARRGESGLRSGKARVGPTGAAEELPEEVDRGDLRGPAGNSMGAIEDRLRPPALDERSRTLSSDAIKPSRGSRARHEKKGARTPSGSSLCIPSLESLEAGQGSVKGSMTSPPKLHRRKAGSMVASGVGDGSASLTTSPELGLLALLSGLASASTGPNLNPQHLQRVLRAVDPVDTVISKTVELLDVLKGLCPTSQQPAASEPVPLRELCGVTHTFLSGLDHRLSGEAAKQGSGDEVFAVVEELREEHRKALEALEQQHEQRLRAVTEAAKGAQRASAQEATARLQARLETARSEGVQLSEELERCRAQLLKAEAERSELQHSHEERLAALTSELQDAAQASEAKLSSHSAAMAALADENAEKTERLQELEHALAEQKSSAEAAAEQLRIRLECLQDQWASVQTELQRRDEMIGELQDSLARATAAASAAGASADQPNGHHPPREGERDPAELLAELRELLAQKEALIRELGTAERTPLRAKPLKKGKLRGKRTMSPRDPTAGDGVGDGDGLPGDLSALVATSAFQVADLLPLPCGPLRKVPGCDSQPAQTSGLDEAQPEEKAERVARAALDKITAMEADVTMDDFIANIYQLVLAYEHQIRDLKNEYVSLQEGMRLDEQARREQEAAEWRRKAEEELSAISLAAERALAEAREAWKAEHDTALAGLQAQLAEKEAHIQELEAAARAQLRSKPLKKGKLRAKRQEGGVDPRANMLLKNQLDGVPLRNGTGDDEEDGERGGGSAAGLPLSVMA
eukprot:RCo020173